MASALVAFARLAKPLLSRTIYRPGRVARILFGPARGLRYIIPANYGLAHLYGGWEPAVVRAILAHVRPGGVAYDCGANYGLHSLLMARQVGAAGRVYAFEPLPEIRAKLERNVALNDFAQIEVVGRAVSDTCGVAAMSTGHHLGAGHMVEQGRGDRASTAAGSIQDVELVTLDRFVADGARPPTFIKVDVEGAEGAVLKGAERLLSEHRPVWLIELHSPDQDVAVGTTLRRHGYAVTRIDPPGPPITDLTVGWPNQHGVWGTILATPRAAAER